MNYLESQLPIIARNLASLTDQIRQLTARVGALEQNQWLSGGGGAFGSPYTPGAFYIEPGANIPAATGTFPSVTPGSASSVTIYQATGSGVTSVGTATVYNFTFAPTKGGFATSVLPDGAGNYNVTPPDFEQLAWICYPGLQVIPAANAGTMVPGASAATCTVYLWSGTTVLYSLAGVTLYNPFIHPIGNGAVLLNIPCVPMPLTGTFMAIAQLSS